MTLARKQSGVILAMNFRDIAGHFSAIEQLRYICEDGYVSANRGCGRGLKALYSSPVLQNFLNHVPMKQSYCEKGIYQPGALRKCTGRNKVPFRSLQLRLKDAVGISIADLPSQRQPFNVS